MRERLRIALLLGSLGLVGCGGEAANTDPTKLPPLTDADLAQAQQYDDEVAEAEGGTAYGPKTPPRAAKGKAGVKKTTR